MQQNISTAKLEAQSKLDTERRNDRSALNEDKQAFVASEAEKNRQLKQQEIDIKKQAAIAAIDKFDKTLAANEKRWATMDSRARLKDIGAQIRSLTAAKSDLQGKYMDTKALDDRVAYLESLQAEDQQAVMPNSPATLTTPKGATQVNPQEAITKLQAEAKAGNAKAQAYLKSKGLSW
jgi:predicted glutamine amidotransferase